jgi:DNA-binding NarL/FixJ family response regulator
VRKDYKSFPCPKYSVILLKIQHIPYLPFCSILVKWRKYKGSDRSQERAIHMFRALIVEDSNFYRKLLRETLFSQFPKMDISEAVDGEEALKKVNAIPPDLIFMDIKLSGESGLEVTRKIKTQYPNIVVIILTSYDLPEYREAASQYKANHFLSKGSATREHIVSLVKSILSERNIDMNKSNHRE